jgi:hypothetical protein
MVLLPDAVVCLFAQSACSVVVQVVLIVRAQCFFATLQVSQRARVDRKGVSRHVARKTGVCSIARNMLPSNIF